MIRYWKIIKHSSYDDRVGYNPSWIQEAFYYHTKVVVDQRIINAAIKEVRYLIKKHKDSEKRKNKRVEKLEKKGAKIEYSDPFIQYQ